MQYRAIPREITPVLADFTGPSAACAAGRREDWWQQHARAPILPVPLQPRPPVSGKY